MGSIRNKQRLLHLYNYLYRYTDEEHQVTTNDLVEFLKKEDANASRKTVKDDIEVLIKEGADIVTTKSYYNSYFMGSRIFEVPEIKLMADDVASNRSLTIDQKQKMIKKVLDLTSTFQAEKLSKSIVYSNGRGSERFYYNIDGILDAISGVKKIEFHYYDYSPTGEKVLKGGGQSYIITPYALICNYNRFYVIGYDDALKRISVYRLDLIVEVIILEGKGEPKPDDLDLSQYVDSLFRMKPGPLTEVVLECDNDRMSTVIDKFGEGVDFWKSSADRFYVKVPVCISDAFYAWIFMQAGGIRIVSPANAVNGFSEMIRKVTRQEKRK